MEPPFFGPSTYLLWHCLLWYCANCIHLFYFHAHAINLFDENIYSSPLK